jgi:hypothetical protein
VPIVLKSGSLNLLEPSGPVKACNGIALSAFTLAKVSSFVGGQTKIRTLRFDEDFLLTMTKVEREAWIAL